MGGASGGGNNGGGNTGSDEGFFKTERDKKEKNLKDHEKNMRDNRGDNTKVLNQKPVSLNNSPTTMEIDQAQSTSSTELSPSEKKIQTNKKGRTNNILTSASGLGDNNLLIKKKTLGAA